MDTAALIGVDGIIDCLKLIRKRELESFVVIIVEIGGVIIEFNLAGVGFKELSFNTEDKL